MEAVWGQVCISSPHIPLVRIDSPVHYLSSRQAGESGIKEVVVNRYRLDIGTDIDAKNLQVHTSYSLYPLINTCGKKIRMEWNWRQIKLN